MNTRTQSLAEWQQSLATWQERLTLWAENPVDEIQGRIIMEGIETCAKAIRRLQKEKLWMTGID